MLINTTITTSDSGTLTIPDLRSTLNASTATLIIIDLLLYELSIINVFRISFLLKLEPIFTAIYSILLLGNFLKTS